MIYSDLFKDVTKFAKKLPTSDYQDKGKHPIIDQGQKQIAGYTDIEEGLFSDVPAIIFGDHTRVIKYIDTPFFIGADGVKVIKCKEEQANYNYLFYLLSSVRIPNTGYNRHYKWLKEAHLVEHSKEEQEKIVAVLSTIDNILDLYSVQLNKLDELIKSRFVEMFGDETNPQDLPVVNVEDVADVSVGVVIKPAQYYTDSAHGIKAFRSLNIGSMRIMDSDWVYFSQEGNERNAKSQLKENDLLVVRSGAPGTSCVVTKQYEGCNAIDIIIARPNITQINPYYLCTYTNMPHGKRQIVEGTSGAAQQHFNVGKYNKLRVMLPSIELQNRFVDVINQIDKSKLAVKQSIDKLETIKKSLMQEYFG